MKPGDLILFVWPDRFSNVDDPLIWEEARIGMVIEISVLRPDDVKYSDELLVLHEGERWSVPATWCRLIKESE